METGKNEWQIFEREWTGRIIESINEVRTREGLTVRNTAERLRALGWSVSDATLSGILSGNKRTSISIAELFAFARVLNVPPLYLMLALPNPEPLPDHELWQNGEYASNNLYEVTSWINGESIAIFNDTPTLHEQFAKVRRDSSAAVFFIGRISRLTETLRSIGADLVALNDLQYLEDAWVSGEESRLKQQAVDVVSALRSHHNRLKTLSQEESLRSIPLPPLPAFLKQADPHASIQQIVNGASLSDWRTIASNERLETSARIVQRRYELSDRDRIEDFHDGSPT